MTTSITPGVTTSHHVHHENIHDLLNNGVVAVAGTTYTTVLADFGKVIESGNAAASTFTIPPNASVAYPIGTELRFMQGAAGALTIAAGSGVTFNKPAAQSLTLSEQWTHALFRKRATNTWVGTLG